MKRIWFLLVICLMLIPPVYAKEIGGVDMPDSLEVNDTRLVLNGAGLRKKFIIKVYAAGLYLMQKTTDPQKIVDADEPMQIRLHFIYDGVSKDKLIDAWNEGFQKGTAGNIEPIKNKIDQFNSYFTEEAKKNDIYDLVYTPQDGLEVIIKGKSMGKIGGLEFKKAVFSIWLGQDTALPKLKEDLLGK